MFLRDKAVYSIETKKHADQTVLSDIANRAFWLSIVAAVFSSLYGITSLEFIQKFQPSVTLWQNVYPRFLFNSLPFFALAFGVYRSKKITAKRLAFGTVGFFTVYMACCCVYVWPIMQSGKDEIYFFVHSSNIWVATIFLLILAPPPILNIVSLLAYFLLVTAPVAYFLHQNHNQTMLSWLLNETFSAILVPALFANNIYLLRRKLARADIYNQQRTKTYLGEQVADAILNRREDELSGKKVHGFILAMDLRGYSNFKKNTSTEIYHKFMNSYHANVSQIVGKYNGYIHKTNGDGHLISFGVMNAPPDLSDIPGIESDLKRAEEQRRKHEFELANAAIHEIQNEFFKIKNHFLIGENLRVGSALTYGEITMVHRGHESHKMEFDIDGDVILRAARLETYTKNLAQGLETEEGICIYSPELNDLLNRSKHMHRWEITSEADAVRDNPHIKFLLYKSFTNDYVEKYLAS